MGALGSNCYLLYQGQECLIVDPGDSADFISQKIESMGLKPKGIVLTHGHFDHVGATTELKLIYELPLWASSLDNFLLARSGETSEHFTGIKTLKTAKPDKDLNKTREILLAGTKLKVIKTPGHTPGSICLLFGKIALVGDLMFGDGSLGRCDFSYSDRGKLKKSIQKVLNLPGDTLIYPGHGNEFYLGEIKDKIK